MTGHGCQRHVHRLAAPKKMPILRKTTHYLAKSKAGPHAFKESIPLLVALRDVLGITQNARESRHLLNGRKVLVDQKVRTELKFPIGLMDTVSFPDVDEHYRVVFGKDGKVHLKEISREESARKFCKILNKVKVKLGKIQLNLHDGRNLLVDEDKFKTGDTLVISLPDQKVIDHLPRVKNSQVYITDGKHIGEIGKIIDFRPMPSSYADRVELTPEKGDNFETLNRYIFVVGKDKPLIKID
ncbi:MAG TPA: 30S ribosomal protein S4e [Candidatus Woesearchaeota archaeon]|nr:30S ribosomal protein S4e [Candidatus Woesearchaeota archaeon]